MFGILRVYYVLDLCDSQYADVANFSIYIHSAPGFVFDDSTAKSPFFRGRELKNSIQVIDIEARKLEEWHSSLLICLISNIPSLR